MVSAVPLPLQDKRAYTEQEQIQVQLNEIQMYNDLAAKDDQLVKFIKDNCQ